MAKPYVIIAGTSYPGGEVHDLVVEDAASKTEYYLEVAGPVYCLQMVPQLRDMVAKKYWRSQAAADVLAKVLALQPSV